MVGKITRDTIESHLRCRLKARLQLAAEPGAPSEYQQLLTDRRAGAAAAAVIRIQSWRGHGSVLTDSAVTVPILSRGATLILNATLSADDLCIQCDALRRVGGASEIGDFHYVPVLFSADETARRDERIMLAACGLALSALQGERPAYGFVVRGRTSDVNRVVLSPATYAQTRALLDDLRQVRDAAEPPKLMLNPHCAICEFAQQCTTRAREVDDLSQLRALRPKQIAKLNAKGIFTVVQLACTFRPRRHHRRKSSRCNPHNVQVQAMAIRDRKIYVMAMPQLPQSSVQLYMDVEGDPLSGDDYLVGLIVCRDGHEQRYSFWADTPEQEVSTFCDFLQVVQRCGDYQLFHYGSYESKYLRKMAARTQGSDATAAAAVLDRAVNVLSFIYSHVYFPVYQNGLKDIGRYLGCSWSDSNASGLQSIVWRRRWAATRDPVWKERLLTYNLEDCQALRRVTEVLNIIARHDGSATADPASNLPIEDPDLRSPWPSGRRWGTPGFTVPDLAYVNKCAYFDYQRDHVFVRTSNSLRKKRHEERRRRRQKRFRVNERIRVTTPKCPRCGGSDIGQGGRVYRKLAFDLKITPAGITRHVVECSAAQQQCKSCGATFLPPVFKNRDKHLHALKSWAIQQHVGAGLSLRRIGTMFHDFFGLPLAKTYLHMFKAEMAQRYEESYRQLIARLVSGPLLHADETAVHLTSGRAYVWVFASIEEVVYVYKPTRQGGFLREFLKDFKGVLVSDFYAAYDAIECPQQKCLIHLIRDLNDELLRNPFDTELKELVNAFGQLLRAAVEAVDAHGLKSRHLIKHAPAVEQFFDGLERSPSRSEAAEGVRRRLLKNRGKLFTFLRHDGVPWNNNCAENAIKQFAYYREDRASLMTAAGLKDYLVLMSLAQTCRFRGVSFLNFLLSREPDVCAFMERRKPYAGSVIEVYLPGFPSPTKHRKGDAALRAASDTNVVNANTRDLSLPEAPPFNGMTTL